MPVSEGIVRKEALALEGVVEAPSYGTPGFRVRGKLFARLHDDGESLVVRVDPIERELMLTANPDVFFITDHYLGHPWVLVRLARISATLLRATLREAWEVAQLKAPAGAVKRRG